MPGSMARRPATCDGTAQRPSASGRGCPDPCWGPWHRQVGCPDRAASQSAAVATCAGGAAGRRRVGHCMAGDYAAPLGLMGAVPLALRMAGKVGRVPYFSGNTPINASAKKR